MDAVTIITDHKSNISITNKNVSQVHSPRLQSLRMKLLKYDLKCEYLPGKHLYVADCLSRNYSSEQIEQGVDVIEIVHSVAKYMKMKFREQSVKDEIPNIVMYNCIEGRENRKYEAELKVFYQLRVFNDIVFYQGRVVVPKCLHELMLKIIHEGNFGVTRTKERALELLFWPGMLADIERVGRSCSVCECHRVAYIPELPFQKLGADILKINNKNYLVVVHYITKWLEVIPLRNKQSWDVVNAFKQIFVNYGVHGVIISDNMPSASWECRRFAKELDCEKKKKKKKKKSPGYPRSNELAKRFVQTAKNILRKSNDPDLALMEYRDTTIPELQRSSAQLLFGRALKLTCL
ncbi:hypothetical protein PR048_029818 [Dryococelus australis]|uniref:RNA-directed DNA polymerase n=1 Tax=Dryococelus australis TaxID=614101 RepID=A0ABQ9G9Z5_9NEOP|nr:hypothetical protein PR048_029818 [Dryococelus australis]